jgi:ribosomal protein S27AE
MPSLGEWAEKALSDSRQRAQVQGVLAAWHRRRALASKGFVANHRTTECPCCGDGLKRASGEGWKQTVLYCGRCHWTAVLPFVMDEARTPGMESYTPGITGRVRGTVRAVIRSDGKLVRLLDASGRSIEAGG